MDDTQQDSSGLSHIISSSIRRTPDEVAIYFSENKINWAEIAAVADKLAAELPDSVNGSVVGLLARNKPATLACFLAILANGWTVSIINPYQSSDRVAQDIIELSPSAVIGDPGDWSEHAVKAAGESGTISIKTFIDGTIHVERVNENGDAAHRSRRIAPDVAVFMITSGTTGHPKRVPLNRRTLHLSIIEMVRMSKAMGDETAAGGEPIIQHVSLAHLAGIMIAIQMAVEHRPLVLLEKFTVDAWVNAVRTAKPKMTGLTPAMMRMILAEDVPSDALASLVAVRSGTAPLDDRTQGEWERRYQIPVLSNYGATEYCGPIASWSLADHAEFGTSKRGSVGRLNDQVAAIKVVDPATGKELSHGESGLLHVQAYRVGVEWISTNDLGRIDAEGFVYLEGRADDAINRGGFKIVPEFVADVLRAHPSILDIAIIGIADSRLGQVPIAFFEPLPEVAAPTEAELMAFARERLIAYQVPIRILALDALPRTPSGKVARPGLRQLIEKGILDDPEARELGEVPR